MNGQHHFQEEEDEVEKEEEEEKGEEDEEGAGEEEKVVVVILGAVLSAVHKEKNTRQFCPYFPLPATHVWTHLLPADTETEQKKIVAVTL